MPDIPNLLSYAYHLLSRPCPTANVGRNDVGCGIVQPKTGICACTLCGVGDSLCSATLRHKSCACEIVSAGNIIVGCNNNPGKIRHRTGGRAMKNETRCTENKLPSVRSTNNTGYPNMSDSLCSIVVGIVLIFYEWADVEISSLATITPPYLRNACIYFCAVIAQYAKILRT